MQNFSSILKKIVVVIIILTIAGYAYYRTKDFIIGPTITIHSPRDGELVNLSLVEIYGTAKNISYISVNDRQVFTDEEGKFKEKLLLYPGYNIISIKAIDRFERDIEKTLELVYKEPEQDLEPGVPNESSGFEKPNLDLKVGVPNDDNSELLN